MEPIKIIGISGRAGSGKDHIAKNILQPMGFYSFSLAWHFKVWLVGKGEATHEEVFVTKPPKVRKLLQLEGTERGRDIHGENIWCNTVLEWMNLLNESWGMNKYIIPDVRFSNECRLIKNMGGIILRINAPKREANSGLTEEARNHISETALDGKDNLFDAIINNDPEYQDTVYSQIISAIHNAGIGIPISGSKQNVVFMED